MNSMISRQVAMLLCLALAMGSWLAAPQTYLDANEASDDVSSTATPIQHLVVVMQQNHTFDNYFGTYPGADGIPPGTCMPESPADPTDCVSPYHIGDNSIADLTHNRRTFLGQYNEGAMDGFVATLNALGQDGRIAMGYYDDRELPYYWSLADEYVLFDRFFSSARAGSVPNGMFWVAAVPGGDRTEIPREGYHMPTIFDRLHEAGVPWKFYVRDYDPALTYRVLPEVDRVPSQIAWVPLNNFGRFLDDPERASRIVDLDEYYRDLENGTLPAVSYVVLMGATEHPLHSVELGQRVVRSMINALKESSAWEHSAFMLTYDEWGGWYDHVPPPQVDEFGYGFRVPALLVSPYARRGYIDNTTYDFTSILAFIQRNWDLPPLAERDSKAATFEAPFDFSQAPRPPRILPFARMDAPYRAAQPQAAIYASYGGGVLVAGALLLVALLWRRRRA